MYTVYCTIVPCYFSTCWFLCFLSSNDPEAFRKPSGTHYETFVLTLRSTLSRLAEHEPNSALGATCDLDGNEMVVDNWVCVLSTSVQREGFFGSICEFLTFFRRNFQIMVPRQRRHRDRITVHVTAAIGWMFLVAMINASGSSVGVAGALWQLQFPLPWLRCLIPNDRSMEGSSIPIRGLFKDYCTPWTIHLTFSEPHPSPIQARKQPPENWLHHLLSFWLEISWWIWVPKLSGSISKAAWSEAFVMPIRCDGTAYVMHVRRQR